MIRLGALDFLAGYFLLGTHHAYWPGIVLGEGQIRSVPELYPTLEVVPSTVKTDSFLAHSAVPVSFTEEDFEQVAAGNFVVKVIYLPDPSFQELAATGLGEIVSTRLYRRSGVFGS